MRVLLRARRADENKPLKAAEAVEGGKGDPTNPPSEGKLRQVFLEPAVEAKPRLLVSLLGIDGAQLPVLVGAAMRSLEAGRYIVVFLTSSLGFEVFRGQMFEYLPTISVLGLSDRATYARFVMAKYSIVLEKWKPQKQLSIGVDITEFAAA